MYIVPCAHKSIMLYNMCITHVHVYVQVIMYIHVQIYIVNVHVHYKYNINIANIQDLLYTYRTTRYCVLSLYTWL